MSVSVDSLMKAIDIQAPSIDRPFGIHLWPLFDQLYTAVTGTSANDFVFQPGVNPISTFKDSACIIAAYYAILAGGSFIMKGLPAFKLKTIFQIHNFALTLVSGGLLLLFIEQIIPTLYNNGLFYTICNVGGGWTQPLVLLYYLNYLTKYVELLDTIFLVVKKKPLTFLHCYHHGATALLCFTQLVGSTSVSWVPISINLMVHVVMYWYYFQSARGIRVWWKQWITRLQIAQFVIDIGFIYFASYTYFTSTYWPHIPNAGNCAGEEYAAYSGVGVITSYLVLFISFYVATYKKGGKPSVKKTVQNGTAAINGNGNGVSNGKAVNGSAKKANGNGAVRSRKA